MDIPLSYDGISPKPGQTQHWSKADIHEALIFPIYFEIVKTRSRHAFPLPMYYQATAKTIQGGICSPTVYHGVHEPLEN